MSGGVNKKDKSAPFMKMELISVTKPDLSDYDIPESMVPTTPVY